MTHHRLRWFLVALATMMAAGVLSTAGAFARDDRNPRPTVVLVHGAFADASSWSPVIARLQAPRRLSRRGACEPAARDCI